MLRSLPSARGGGRGTEAWRVPPGTGSQPGVSSISKLFPPVPVTNSAPCLRLLATHDPCHYQGAGKPGRGPPVALQEQSSEPVWGEAGGWQLGDSGAGLSPQGGRFDCVWTLKAGTHVQEVSGLMGYSQQHGGGEAHHGKNPVPAEGDRSPPPDTEAAGPPATARHFLGGVGGRGWGQLPLGRRIWVPTFPLVLFLYWWNLLYPLSLSIKTFLNNVHF